jgi:hypothetical protein
VSAPGRLHPCTTPFEYPNTRGRNRDKLSPICPRFSLWFKTMSEKHLRVSNNELATVREAMRELNHLLDRLDRCEVDKIVLTQRNQMRAVLITPERYSELEHKTS